MGQETLMMTWRQLREHLSKANVRDQDNRWRELRDHEKYMEQKGYRFTGIKVISPEGEVIWQERN